MALVSVQSYPGHTTHFFLCVWHLLTLTSAHHQQFPTTTYIFSFVIMSSFLLKKSICGKLCFSVSIWRNRIECLWRPMATMLYRKQRAEIGFASSMTILIWVTRSVKISQEGWLSIAGSFGQGRYPIARMLAEQLSVSQTAISMRLHARGKVQKIGKWMPHER